MDPLVFKKWSNRGWSVFASLRRVVIVATLCVSYQMLAQESSGESGDSARIMHMELEDVESTAPWPGDLEEAGLKPLVRVTRTEIEAAPAAHTHEEILKALPEVDLRQRGKHGTQADLGIRGGTFDQALVLLNGIPLSDPQTGHFALHLPLSIQATSAVEVLSGSATRSHGIHAFSGAVNLLSQPADSSSYEASIMGGQHGFYKGQINIHLSGKKYRNMINAGSSGSRFFRKPGLPAQYRLQEPPRLFAFPGRGRPLAKRPYAGHQPP